MYKNKDEVYALMLRNFSYYNYPCKTTRYNQNKN